MTLSIKVSGPVLLETGQELGPRSQHVCCGASMAVVLDRVPYINENLRRMSRQPPYRPRHKPLWCHILLPQKQLSPVEDAEDVEL